MLSRHLKPVTDDTLIRRQWVLNWAQLLRPTMMWIRYPGLAFLIVVWRSLYLDLKSVVIVDICASYLLQYWRLDSMYSFWPFVAFEYTLLEMRVHVFSYPCLNNYVEIMKIWCLSLLSLVLRCNVVLIQCPSIASDESFKRWSTTFWKVIVELGNFWSKYSCDRDMFYKWPTCLTESLALFFLTTNRHQYPEHYSNAYDWHSLEYAYAAEREICE